MTLGEKRVIVDFNINDDKLVGKIKQDTAKLINTLEELKSSTSQGEGIRLISLAQTAYEEAAMWAVKAITI